MTSLDSRSLRYTDCYARLFAAPGEARYSITTAAGMPFALEPDEYVINVKEAPSPREGEQHMVTVRREGRRFVAEPSSLDIVAGDSVMWHAPDTSLMGFAVRGQDAAGGFDSRALEASVVYTHAFGTPGEFAWVDANGSGLGGIVHVRPPQTEARAYAREWAQRVTDGFLVVISGDRADPPKLEVDIGQTVFFAVEKARGITITDRSLLGEGPSGPA
jgi:plastocyanin